MITYKSRIVAFGLLMVGGCTEASSPTSALLEQAVHTALGGLRVGETLSLRGDDAAQILLGGSPVAGEFVYIPFHASESRGANLVLTVTGENVAAIDVDAALLPLPAGNRFGLDARAVPDDDMHMRLHERLQGYAEARLPSLRPRLTLTPGDDAGIRTQLGGGSAQIGQLVQLNTSTSSAPGAFCNAVDDRTGRVEAITDHSIVVGDTANPTNGFTRADYESFGNAFDDLVHPTVTRYFPEPTDIDENGKVIIFFTRAVNEMTEPDMDGYIGGFFYSRDLFPATGADACPASNEGEIFYVLAPDPNAEASHIEHTRDAVFNDAVGTIGHEYVHLINASRRVWINEASAFEETWLDEGLAHIAEEVLFFVDAGVEAGGNFSVADLERPDFRDAINRFGVQNLSRYGLYLEEVTRGSPTNTDDSLETRGAAWAFLRYASDHTPASDEEFFTGLVDTQLVGHDNLRRALDDEPVEWFQRWGVSIFTDDLVAEPGNPTLQQPTWNFRSLLPRLFTGYPLAVETLGEGDALRLELRAATSGYVHFRGERSETTRLTTTSGGTEVLPSTLRVTIVRVE